MSNCYMRTGFFRPQPSDLIFLHSGYIMSEGIHMRALKHEKKGIMKKTG